MAPLAPTWKSPSCVVQLEHPGVGLQIAGGAEAGLLGGGWIVVLRTLSTLEALQVGGTFVLGVLADSSHGSCCKPACQTP